jgi:hypothetical protein
MNTYAASDERSSRVVDAGVLGMELSRQTPFCFPHLFFVGSISFLTSPDRSTACSYRPP